MSPMTEGVEHDNHLVTGSEFFSRAQERLTFDVPEALTNPDAIARPDPHNADPAVLAAIAAVRPTRPAAVLVPVVQRDEPSVLFTERTAGLTAHGGEISFPGGKIDAGDATPVAAALREAEEEIALSRRFVSPIGYLDLHMTPFGHRILPVLAHVREGFSLRINHSEVADVFEVPLAFLMSPKNHKRESRDWSGLTVTLYAIHFGNRKIWGATAGILRNLYERLCHD
jgi:8-oxo-dGTP pyrophosphatase MutT (NUDIX family)